MTVIAWDGKTLAADKRGCTGSAHLTVTKIARVGDCLVGYSGSAERWGRFRVWLEGGRDPEKYPPNPPPDTLFMLVIHPDGTVERFETEPYPFIVEDRHVALGSGSDFARAAMYFGRTAEYAVEFAGLFDESCGNGVDVLTFQSGESCV